MRRSNERGRVLVMIAGTAAVLGVAVAGVVVGQKRGAGIRPAPVAIEAAPQVSPAELAAVESSAQEQAQVIENLERELGRLRSDLQSVRTRLGSMEALVGPENTPGESVVAEGPSGKTDPEFVAVNPYAAGSAGAGLGSSTAVAGSLQPGGQAASVDPVFKAAVQVAMDELRRDEQQRREIQDADRQRERAAREVERLAQRLNLDERQKEKFTALISERDTTMRGLWRTARDGEMDRSDARTVMRGARETYETQVKELLTPQQYTELEAVRAEEGNDDGPGRRRGRGPQPAPQGQQPAPQ